MQNQKKGLHPERVLCLGILALDSFAFQLPRHGLRGPTKQTFLLGGLKLLGQKIWRFLVGKRRKAYCCRSCFVIFA